MSMWQRDVFERREPPPGGLALLRTRLDRRARAVPIGFGVTLSAAAILLVTWWKSSRLTPPEQPARWAVDHPALAVAPTEPVTVRAAAAPRVAVQRVKSSREDIVFYWLATAD
jgi:hypothetical protein